MGFEEYSLRSGGSRSGMTPNDVSIAVNGKSNLNLSIVIGHELLKSSGMAIGDKVSLYFGTGEDKGKLLIKKTLIGVVISDYIRKGKVEVHHGQVIRKIAPVAPIEDFTNKQIASHVVESVWDTEAGGIMVTLPDGFFTK